MLQPRGRPWSISPLTLFPMTFAGTLRRGCTAALVLSFALVAGAGAQPQNVAGARVALEPPAGFTPSPRFPGFEHEASGSSILIAELPREAFDELRAGFTAENLGARGVTLRETEAARIGGSEGVLLAVSQNAHGTAFDRWIGLFATDSASVIVTATYPSAAAAELAASMRQAVLSARMREGAVDVFEGLAFRLTESPRLKIAERVANMLMLTETGDLSQTQLGAPYLMVAGSLSPGPMDDVEAFSRGRIGQTDGIVDVANLAGTAVTIDGIAGYELVADAREEDTSRPVRIYQVVLPEGSDYVIVQGIVATNRAAEWIPEFRAVAQSLRRSR